MEGLRSAFEAYLWTNCTAPSIFDYIPQKPNIAPENGPLEDEIPVGNHPFSGAMLVSGRVNLSEQYLSVAGSCLHVFLKKITIAEKGMGTHQPRYWMTLQRPAF